MLSGGQKILGVILETQRYSLSLSLFLFVFDSLSLSVSLSLSLFISLFVWFSFPPSLSFPLCLSLFLSPLCQILPLSFYLYLSLSLSPHWILPWSVSLSHLSVSSVQHRVALRQPWCRRQAVTHETCWMYALAVRVLEPLCYQAAL